MIPNQQESGLFTDTYQLTMLQAHWLKHGDNPPKATYEFFIRKVPFGGGYLVLAGVKEMLDYFKNLKFGLWEKQQLQNDGRFREDFINWLGNFKFKATVRAMKDGTVFFPQEPAVQVHGTIYEGQLIESALLNFVNFGTLIATKAARVVQEAGGGIVTDNGLRRAHGPDASLLGSKYTYIGGAEGTSNLYAARYWGIPAYGTMAHAWVMAFPNELSAFQAYAKAYPDNCGLLIDTYDTMKSGLRNAITVAKELEAEGKYLKYIRIDSGDLAYLYKKVRAGLDAAGINYVKIILSGDLDESLISELRKQSIEANVWAVGTNMSTGAATLQGGGGAMPGVYKLVEIEVDGVMSPRFKMSNNPAKSTLPYAHQVWRYQNDEGPEGDLITLHDQIIEQQMIGYNPLLESQSIVYLKDMGQVRPLLHLAMDSGEIDLTFENDLEIHICQQRCKSELNGLHTSYKRQVNAHIYKVSISEILYRLRNQLRERYLNDIKNDAWNEKFVAKQIADV